MEKSMSIAVVAVIISVVAIVSAVALKPTLRIGAGAIGTNELANGSVTGEKILDGTVTDVDITTDGISNIADDAVGSGQIADNSIALQDLSSDVAAVIAGVENIADNSITGAKIQDGTITDVDISVEGISRIADNSITGAMVQDGTLIAADVSPDMISSLNGVSNDGGNIDLISTDGSILIVPQADANAVDLRSGVVVTQTAETYGEAVDTTTAVWDSYESLADAGMELTTGNNPVLITFSGVFSNDTAGGRVRIGLLIDDVFYGHTTRTGTSAAAGDPFVLSFTCIPTLSEGTHNIRVAWCVMSAGQQGSAYNRVLDIVEFKR
jgi:hypothetical protein